MAYADGHVATRQRGMFLWEYINTVPQTSLQEIPMKTFMNRILIAIVGAFGLVTLCGTALATPVNAIFLQVDINGNNGPTQTNVQVFQGWNFDLVPAGNSWTTNFYPSNFLFTSSLTPTGPVSVTIFATNYLFPFGPPSWYYPPNSPCTLNRNSMSGEPWADLYNDFLRIDGNTNFGFGGDVISLTFSNLFPNTNYEITVWNYDQNDTETSTFEAWGVVNPTNNPSYLPLVGGGGLTPKLARIHKGGMWPSNYGNTNAQEYVYSGSFFVTTDPNGSATVYGWEDNDSYGGFQDTLLNGFAIGFAPTVTTVINPVPASYSPTNVVWPYTAGIAILSDGTNTTFTLELHHFKGLISRSACVIRVRVKPRPPSNGAVSDCTWYNTDEELGTNQIMGETFQPFRDFMLRNFYIAGKGSTNSGLYVLVLYDLGTGSLPSCFNPSTYTNLLSHPQLRYPQYWSFNPRTLTNEGIVKFKFALADQVYMTNGHNYFLGLLYAGGGTNDFSWERTTSSQTYANGSGYEGRTNNVCNNIGSLRNFIMAVDVLNPNFAITVSNTPLASGWPGTPILETWADPNDANLDNSSCSPDWPQCASVPMRIANGQALSMGFYAPSNFYLSAVAYRMHGIGSSNLLFTLAAYDLTNTFFTATDSIEHFPRNFQANIDSDPKGIPIFLTNLDFYYTQAQAGDGTNDQILLLTIDPAYRPLIKSNHAFAVEVTAETIGQNANNGGEFVLIRDTGWQHNYGSTNLPNVTFGFFQDDLFPANTTRLSVNPCR